MVQGQQDLSNDAYKMYLKNFLISNLLSVYNAGNGSDAIHSM